MVGVCGVAAFAVVSAVASVDAGLVAEPLAAGPSVFPWPVFGVPGAVAVNLASVELSTGVKSAVVAGAPELVTGSGAETAVFAVVLSAAVVEVVPVSVLPATDGPGGGAIGCELAVIAAAAMASGAVGPPGVGVGVGVGAVLVAGADVGTATATGVGVEVAIC